MEKLRQARKAAGLTQKQLAERAKLRRATVADLEAGKTDCLLSTLEALADALGRKPADLLN